jgi:DNA-binding CsgD family transcriptional regulator
MAVVKADGFGHGQIDVARAALAGGATRLGVTSIDEARPLRAAGLTQRILSWLNPLDADFAAAVRLDIELGVPGLDHLHVAPHHEPYRRGPGGHRRVGHGTAAARPDPDRPAGDHPQRAGRHSGGLRAHLDDQAGDPVGPDPGRLRRRPPPVGLRSRRAFLGLTDKEREVFTAVARGLSNAEIAGTVFASESTVKTHVGAILRKLALRDRVQIVVFAHEHGLV